MRKNKAGANELITLIIEGAEEVKGLDISLLDLRGIENTVCDYFVICTGTSNTHVNAIVSSIQKTVSKTLHEKPWHIEGTDNASWVLMDFVNVVVHVFLQEQREFYDIEGLWGDAKVTLVESSYK